MSHLLNLTINIIMQNEWVIWFLIIINIVTFSLFVIDKQRSIKRKRRIRNATLLTCSFLGGSLGGLLAMLLYRHKTRKWYYVIGLPMMIALHLWIISK